MPWFLFDFLEHSYHLNRVPVEVLLVLLLLLQYIYLANNSNCKKCTARNDAPNSILLATTHINWYKHMLSKFSSSLIKVNEWKSDQYRVDNGWKGNDYMHSSNSHVRIFDYFLLRSSDLDISAEEVEVDFALSAVVYFSACAESHKGLCHGGTMCSVMDDAVGWLGFCESGRCLPWSGFTVQIDTSLKRAIAIGSYLKLDVWIERREGNRKLFIAARLFNPETGEDHATAKGLFLKSAKKESKKVQ